MPSLFQYVIQLLFRVFGSGVFLRFEKLLSLQFSVVDAASQNTNGKVAIQGSAFTMLLTKIVHRKVAPILFQGLAWSLFATLEGALETLRQLSGGFCHSSTSLDLGHQDWVKNHPLLLWLSFSLWSSCRASRWRRTMSWEVTDGTSPCDSHRQASWYQLSLYTRFHLYQLCWC